MVVLFGYGDYAGHDRTKKNRRSVICGLLAILTTRYKKPHYRGFLDSAPGGKPVAVKATSGALYFLEHLEDALGCAHEKALERLAKALAFQGIATVPFDFCHHDLRSLLKDT
jgi:hypothetical protein